jgi:hypothetical protein
MFVIFSKCTHNPRRATTPSVLNLFEDVSLPVKNPGRSENEQKKSGGIGSERRIERRLEGGRTARQTTVTSDDHQSA